MPTKTKRSSGPARAGQNGHSPEPRYATLGVEVQNFGTLRELPIGLSAQARGSSCVLLSTILADTPILYSLSKKPAMISRLLRAHELLIQGARDGIEKTEQSKDWGSNDLLMSEVLRRNELQVWFIAEHLVDVPLIED
jgi:ferritin-like protein